MTFVTVLKLAAILSAGIAAGTINTIIGSGSLITFITLLATGYAPVTANVCGTVGLVPGSVSGVIGYRRRLPARRMDLLPVGAAGLAGAAAGGALLLLLPVSSFRTAAPILILGACGLTLIQPRMSRWMALRQSENDRPTLLILATFAAGVYGGYFLAGIGVVLIAVLGAFTPGTDLQQTNALKMVAATAINISGATLFLITGSVEWAPAILIATGSLLGGWIGAWIGQRLPSTALRCVIVSVGVISAGTVIATNL
ncbi:sulfite exporter TauE/SafE family protein [Actinoallomurus acanthiterrae]